MGKWRHNGPLAAALSAGLLVAGCSRTEPAAEPSGSLAANSSAAANPTSEGAPAAAAGPGMNLPAPVAKVETKTAAGQEAERRGPARQARCQIDREAERPCTFTPVFGDGSFDIEMPDRQLRLIVDGDEAAPFELIGERRIPIVGLLRRDPQDRACWVADEPGLGLERVCAR